MLPRLARLRAVGLLGLFALFATSLWPVDAAPARHPQGLPPQATAAPAPLAPSADESVTASTTPAPLAFEPNVGQFPPAIRFQVQALGGTVAFSAQSLTFTLPSQAPAPTTTSPAPRPGQAAGRNPFDRRIAAQPTQPALPPAVLQQHFLDTTPTATTGADQLPGTVGYFQGDDPAGWYTDIPTYGSLMYDALYPGIALAYHGQDSRLKSVFTVAPGADPTRIRWRYEEASAVQVDAVSGDLLVTIPPTAPGGLATTLREAAPLAWQDVDDQRLPVAVRFALASDASVGFALGAYDQALPLVIDPTLSYSLFEAAGPYSGTDDVAVDAAGNVYTVSTLDTSVFGDSRIIVKKTNPVGTELDRGYLVGSDFDFGLSIAVDTQGRVYVGGWTSSPDFPHYPEAGAGQESRLNTPFTEETRDLCVTDYTNSYCSDGFITRLTPDLTLDGPDSYSVTFGGRTSDSVYALAVDGAGNVYATGQTDSLDFPTQAATQGTCDMTNEFCSDGFVLRINAAGTLIDYSSYLGGAWYDSGNGVAVTASGEAYVTGVVNTGDQSEYGDGDSAFLAKFAGDGTQQYRLLLGGPGEDGASSVTVADPTDSQSAVYLTGWTTSGAIAANNASAGFDAYHGGTYDAFLMQLSPQGAIQRTSLIGGDDWDAGADVAVNANGNIFVAGATSSSVSFPAVQAPDNNAGTGTNAFLIMLTADQTNIGLSMQLGGSAGLFGNGSSASAVAVDQMGNAYLVGETYSSDFAGGPTNEDSGVLSRGFLSKVDGLPLAPPEYTVSYYIRDPDSLAAFQLGCDARLNGERGIVVLSFGTPRQFFNDQQQAVTGVMMKGGADVGYLSFNDMSAISVSYAYGYTYWRNCPNIPAASGFEPPPARLTIALGTNNAKRCKPSSDCDERQADDWENNPFLTRQHGETWAAMVNTLNAQTRQLFPGVSFAGAMDVEFDLTTFGSVGTFEWLKGYNSVAAWPYYNYGSCDGCPRTADFDTWGGGPRPDRTNTGGRATTELASNDYPTDALLQAGDARTTVEKVFLASRWFEWALPLPQIYYKDQHLQWYNVVRYASSELRPMFIPGPLTGCASQPQACGLSDKRSWEQPAFGQFPTVPFSPYQGWQALHDTLNGTQAPDGTTPSPISQPFMPWLTDLTSQDLPTAP